uniref:Low-density lipoprotein receptor-related protein 2-like n=1 Tax=Phallusia mammillata TaxID=59560 RepID=A0A6F9DKJ3_9ASCI|nr:low-density lipoprotein receptor-related protein 2-like [Phallusia mammillata]
MMLKLVLYLSILGYLTQQASAETRWCPTTLYDSNISPDGWIPYNDQQMTCLNCSNQSIGLLSNSKVDKYECCEGKSELKGACQSRGNGAFCAGGVQCDGIKQCPDGQDEVGCNECNQTTSFTCAHHADSKPCISSSQVCDGTKDCAEGLDETGCHWHGGWCDGFLCGKPHERCIPKSQVCTFPSTCKKYNHKIWSNVFFIFRNAK